MTSHWLLLQLQLLPQLLPLLLEAHSEAPLRLMVTSLLLARIRPKRKLAGREQVGPFGTLREPLNSSTVLLKLAREGDEEVKGKVRKLAEVGSLGGLWKSLELPRADFLALAPI